MSEAETLANRESFFRTSGQRRYTTIQSALGPVRVRSLTDGEERSLAMLAYDDEGKTIAAEYTAADRLIATVVDEDGDLMFVSNDRERLAALDYAVTKPLIKAIVRHCQVGPYAPTEDELKKN